MAKRHRNRSAAFATPRCGNTRHCRGRLFTIGAIRRHPARVLRSNVSDRESVAALIEAYSQLLSLAVHELRTPTSVVGGYLRMLQRDSDGSLSERERKMIDAAARSCGRIAELINEMSDISKLDGGTAAVRLETFDLFAVVQEVAEGVVEGRDREVRLEVRGDAAGAPIAGDLAR